MANLPCDKCGSSDGVQDYGDHTHCFVCNSHESEGGGGLNTVTPTGLISFNDLSFSGIPSRGITEATCKLWSYGTTEELHAATYFKDGKPVAQKVRKAHKEFFILGSPNDMGLYGAHLWAPHPKKRLTVVEGEIDALSMSQMMNNEWPVVSIPKGAKGAKKVFMENLEYLCGFKQVVIMFDNDDPGRKAAQECAEVLPVGKCSIATLGLNDPNEYLKAGRSREAVKAMWDAKPWTPEGILTGVSIWEAMTAEDNEDTIPYPWPALNDFTAGGMRTGSMVVWTGPTGRGKSSLLGEVAFDLALIQNMKVGYMALEETGRQTGTRLLSLIMNEPLHLMKGRDRVKVISEHREDVAKFENNVAIYDHWGMKKDESLINRIRFMAKSLECRVIILDHISIVVSAMGEANERIVLDKLMTDLRTLVSETDICLHVVSHLSRGDNRDASHEEGGEIKLSHLRSSHSIAQIADSVIALQVNKNDKISLVSLKQRINGRKGKICDMNYDPDTGRLTQVGLFDD